MKTLVAFLFTAALALAADVTGKWNFTVVLEAGSGNPTFEFKQDGEKLTGSYKGQFGEAPLTGTVKGDKIEFTFSGQAGTVKYAGTIDGKKMKGTCEYGEAGKGTFTAEKN
ncbi:MAG TPA: hypothetical protein VGP79_06895 [Bryobacteraceae bacterium]|jgi:hypothetical protein|nr:hypothetical protein [Bryobacteraceae bacterium]